MYRWEILVNILRNPTTSFLIRWTAFGVRSGLGVAAKASSWLDGVYISTPVVLSTIFSLFFVSRYYTRPVYECLLQKGDESSWEDEPAIRSLHLPVISRSREILYWGISQIIENLNKRNGNTMITLNYRNSPPWNPFNSLAIRSLAFVLFLSQYAIILWWRSIVSHFAVLFSVSWSNLQPSQSFELLEGFSLASDQPLPARDRCIVLPHTQYRHTTIFHLSCIACFRTRKKNSDPIFFESVARVCVEQFCHSKLKIIPARTTPFVRICKFVEGPKINTKN